MVNQNNSPSDMGKIPLSDDKNLMNIAQYLKGVQKSQKVNPTFRAMASKALR